MTDDLDLELDDDGFHLAGWMFTDILVGLFVVFLALAPTTLSFAGSAAEDAADEAAGEPSPESSPSPSPSPTAEPETARCRGLSQTPLRFDVDADASQEQVGDAISAAAESLDADVADGFGFVIAFGEGPKENISTARDIASSFVERMIGAAPEMFSGAQTRSYWSGGQLGRVQVEMFPWVNLCAS